MAGATVQVEWHVVLRADLGEVQAVSEQWQGGVHDRQEAELLNQHDGLEILRTVRDLQATPG